ncbi:RNase H domain-containing protein [Trichonephila clavipes]|nr:RNase H domain-containing protein [Trichonephila clavipes]
MFKTESVDTAVKEVTNVLIAAADLLIPKVQVIHSNVTNLSGMLTVRQRIRTSGSYGESFADIYGEYLGVQKGKSKCSQSNASESEEILDSICVSHILTTSSKELLRKVMAANAMYREFSFPILQTSDYVFSSPVEIANILGETFQSVFSTASYNSRD